MVGLVIVSLGVQRYNREVATLFPTQVLSQGVAEGVRVLGTVKGGSLIRDVSSREIIFSLTHEGKELSVRYTGPPPDGLRELKTIVIVGDWDPSKSEFRSHKIAVVPNYGFISAAYLLAFIPLIFFLFYMERRVRLLYSQIKETRPYEPEEIGFDKK